MKAYIAWLDQRISALTFLRQEYAEAERRDDADLTNIRINIFGICKSVCEALTRAGKSWQACREKLLEIGARWEVARAEALEHGDENAAAVEEIKLEAFREAMAQFDAVEEKKHE